MLPIQQTIPFSDYSDLYDLIIPQDNLLRRINDLVDFSFIQKELIDQYCQDNGRMTESPVMMFLKVRFLAMAKLKQVWPCSFGLTKSFLKVRFLAMAKLKQVWLCSFGLTKSFLKVRFLAMVKFKQVWLCSFGLTKSFIYGHSFSGKWAIPSHKRHQRF